MSMKSYVLYGIPIGHSLISNSIDIRADDAFYRNKSL